MKYTDGEFFQKRYYLLRGEASASTSLNLIPLLIMLTLTL